MKISYLMSAVAAACAAAPAFAYPEAKDELAVNSQAESRLVVNEKAHLNAEGEKRSRHVLQHDDGFFESGPNLSSTALRYSKHGRRRTTHSTPTEQKYQKPYSNGEGSASQHYGNGEGQSPNHQHHGNNEEGNYNHQGSGGYGGGHSHNGGNGEGRGSEHHYYGEHYLYGEGQSRSSKSSSSYAPSDAPSTMPSDSPSSEPSSEPSKEPTLSQAPSSQPSDQPSISQVPSQIPSTPPTIAPSVSSAPTGPVMSYSTNHTFSILDILGGFDGSTFGPAGAIQDPTILCGAPGSTAPGPCPDPVMDKDGNMLFPIDSEFGFNTLDFVGGQRLVRDDDYLEGFAGDLADGSGVSISNTATKTYKVGFFICVF